jgi:hypothetical protein
MDGWPNDGLFKGAGKGKEKALSSTEGISYKTPESLTPHQTFVLCNPGHTYIDIRHTPENSDT